MRLVGPQGVIGNVDLQDLLLVGQQGPLIPLDAIGRGHFLGKTRVGVIGEHVEHADLTGILVLLALRGALQQGGLVDEAHELLSGIARRIEGARLDERFEGFAVVALRIHAVHEVMQAGIGPVRVALADDFLDHLLTDAAHTRQTETHAFVYGRELQVGRVDVGGKHLHSRSTAACDVVDQLVVVAHVAGQHCGHEFLGVMRLQESRAHNKHRVAGGVGLIERILREVQGVVPYLARHFQGIAVFLRAGIPVGFQRLHDVELLLTHGLAQLVCLTGRETAHRHGDLHQLLLVDDRAVGFLQDGTQAVVVVDDGALALPSVHVVVDEAVLEGARTVQRDRCDDVGELTGLHAREQRDVQGALHLE